jgi:hypothetical protein
MQAMLTLVFVFMLLNLTSIWKLPTFLIGGLGMKASQGSLALQRGSSSMVALGKRP